jgi:hypothetical protein
VRRASGSRKRDAAVLNPRLGERLRVMHVAMPSRGSLSGTTMRHRVTLLGNLSASEFCSRNQSSTTRCVATPRAVGDGKLS